MKNHDHSSEAGAVAPGAIVPEHQLLALSGSRINLPDEERLVHLQLRRFAGCPICNLHLRSMVECHDDIVAAGIREVVVFHSSTEELAAQCSDLPFDVVADPDRRLYREFGVESSPRALLDPRAWSPTLRGLLHAAGAIASKRQPAPANHPLGGRLGLPADFLIDSGGRVLASKYGAHAYDQWSVDELLELVDSTHDALGSPTH